MESHIKLFFCMCDLFYLDSQIGYIKKLSQLSPSLDRKRKYFTFNMQLEDCDRRVVCFTPERYNLISKIQSQQSGCEITDFTKNEKDELLVGDNATVKQIQPTFERKNHPIQFTTISQCNNEKKINELVNVKGLLCNKLEIEYVKKESKQLKLRKAILSDSEDTIPITLFADLADQIENNISYSFTDVRVSKYKQQRLLKTTDVSTVAQLENDILVDASQVQPLIVTATRSISNVQVNTIEEITVCSQCKNPVEIQDGCATCHSCYNMESEQDCLQRERLGLQSQLMTRRPL